MIQKVKLILAKGLKIILNPPALRNCMIDKTSKVCPRSELTNVTMGKYSYIGGYSFLYNVKIENYCSIAERCCIGGAAHPIHRVSSSPVFHEGKNVLKKNFAEFPGIVNPDTIIENDVWIGMGCYIKAGVKIYTGAVVGMGSVVTKDIPPYEIWAGNPAKKIGERFDDTVKEKLLKSEWWNWEEKKVAEMSLDFDDIDSFFDKLDERNEG